MPHPGLRLVNDPNVDPAILDAAHKALGKALAHWQMVETALYVLAHCLMGTSREMSSIAFFHNTSLQHRLTLIDKLCFEKIKQRAYGGAWKKDLRKMIDDAIDIRNALAHFELSGIRLDKLPDPKPTKFPIVLLPNGLDVVAYRSGAGKGLYVEQLEEAAAEFTQLANKIGAFIAAHVADWQKHVASLPVPGS
jgi:hypothetical protein